ncbi:MAG: glycosyltransferase [Candidatus Levybacteria bacterium]|nr:glycosyltransferase [Candidatus Levybacteria bacterium]
MNKHTLKDQMVSVVVPVYNELKNIETLLIRLSDSLSKLDVPYEIIFVDDNSTDGTSEYLERYIGSKKIILVKKQGKPGKAYCLLEGFEKANGAIIAMIDADLQYPPEAIVEMVKRLDKADIVVANRRQYMDSFTRKTLSRVFRFTFGSFLFGLNHDIQSGLKVFTREVLKTIVFMPKTAWTFDLEFLHRAHQAGFVIQNHDISFSRRKNGNSKVGLFKTAWEIGMQALLLRIKKIHPQLVPPTHARSMIGAGIGYKKRKYITHTTIPHHLSALRTFTKVQKLIISLILIDIGLGFYISPLLTLQLLVAVLSAIYFADVIFNLYLVVKSLSFPREITSTEQELNELKNSNLPVYSILCPLYREASVIPQFLEAMDKLSWPKEKLDVMLLLEEDDKETIEKVEQMILPSYVRTLIVPHSVPKTKPKACNYGLGFAKGEYLVIFDAEDIPDPMQLKKAYLGFRKSDKNVICLQARLNYYNPHQNLLTRFFTAEYSLWFDITLPGLVSIDTALPLGGTSNHFKTESLRAIEGWDPFNVTEDADLGVRLFKKGYKTAMIDSTTFEEANSRVGNWFRQRSRWIKGYMQTYLVHTRGNESSVKGQALHSLIFQLVVGGKIAFVLINPFLWIATFSYFALYAYVGPAIEALYPTVVFYMAVTSLVFGNFLSLYYYMIGVAKKGQWNLMKFVFLIPIYWFMTSISAFIALYQLLFKPHYWEKTVHGFHLQKRFKKAIPQITIEVIEKEEKTIFPNPFRQRFVWAFNLKKAYVSGGLLIGASIAANFLNFIFNAYLGRVLDLANFGLLSLVSSFLYFTQVPFGALGSSVNYRTGFLEGRFRNDSARMFKNWIWKKSLGLALIICGLWIALSPILVNYFSVESLFPFLVFAPVWIFGMIAAVDRGFLSGKLMFGSLAVVALVEPMAKLAATYVFVKSDLLPFVYTAIPIAIILSFFASWVLSNIGKKASGHKIQEVYRFPKKFFAASVLSGLSTITFLSLDIILAKHYLTPEDAGRYALVSLVGKMIYFMGSLTSQFITPLVSRIEGAKKSSKETFSRILFSTCLLSFIGFIAFGLLGSITAPLLFGQKAYSIIPYLPLFGVAMVFFSVSKVFISYYQAKKLYSFSVVTFFLAIVQVIIIGMNHENIGSIVFAMTLVGALNFITMVALHLAVEWVRIFENNINDLFSLLFEKTDTRKAGEKKLRILIFNWRDTKHVWAGGAEAYIHEIAKRWVLKGNHVTVFCGNDAHCPKNQTIDGVHIVRRGGSYMVYAWAFLYYILRFRGRFDAIVDSENGIPFFTPLYARVPVFLLIHHIHQEVFREHLMFPLSSIARFMEAKIMPFVYRKNTVITVSESSKKEILKLGLSKSGDVEIVHPGIKTRQFYKAKKTAYPSFLYLGRLKPYKNVDVAIRALARVVKLHPSAELSIVGEGEMMDRLSQLARRLKIENKVTFFGKISDSDKALLLSQSWVVLQPSQLEGWGITVIEANAAGTPVIASDVSGLRDSVIHGETGVLVELKNIDAFTRAMIDFISDEKYRTYLSRSAYLWSQHFNWDKSAENFFHIIEGALKYSNARSNRIQLVISRVISIFL